jgi:hypothetical protein
MKNSAQTFAPTSAGVSTLQQFQCGEKILDIRESLDWHAAQISSVCAEICVL